MIVTRDMDVSVETADTRGTACDSYQGYGCECGGSSRGDELIENPDDTVCASTQKCCCFLF